MYLKLRLAFLSCFVSLHLFAQTVHIISTTDLHGHLLPNIDVMNGYFSVAKKEDPQTLFLDSGDLFQGTIISNSHEGASVVKWMNHVGYTASAVGNHEFDFGPGDGHVSAILPGEDPLGALKKNASAANFKFLAANITELDPSQNQWFEPYIIRMVNGIRIGIIGLTTQSTPTTTLPANVARLKFESLSQSLEKYVPELLTQKVQGIIIIVHDGDDSIFKVIDALKPQTREAISLVLAGHTHNWVNTTHQGVHILITGSYGQAFGYTTLDLNPKTNHLVTTEIKSVKFLPGANFLGKNVQPNPSASSLLAQEIHEANMISSRVVGHLAAPLVKTSTGESSLGNFMSDAFRFCSEPSCNSPLDVAFLNNGGIRRSMIEAGEVTYGKVFETMPFDNLYTTMLLTGKQIHDLLDSWYSYEHDNPSTQVSGLVITYDPNSVNKRIVKNASGETTTLAEHVKRISLPDGQELNENATYQVALSDFLATGGGGTAFVLKDLPKTIHYDIKLRDQLVNYFQSKSTTWDYRNMPPRVLNLDNKL